MSDSPHPATPMTAAPRLRVALLLVPVLCACEVAPARPTAEVRDSAGVALVTSPVREDLPVWTVSVDDVPTFGSDSTPLYNVVGAARSGDRVVIGNAGSHEILWFDLDGRLVRTAGGQGSGPGEYEWLETLLGVPGDSVLAVDLMGKDVNLYAPDGDLARSWSVETIARLNQPTPRARLASGEVIATTQGTTDPYPGHQNYRLHVLRFRDGALVDTVASMPGTEGWTIVCGPDGSGVCNMGVHFGRVESMDARDGMIAVTGGGQDIRILEGARLARIVRVADPALAVTDALVEARIDSMLAGAEGERARVARERLEESPAAEVVPRFVELHIDHDGFLWAARGDMDAGRWDVFDAEGERVASVRMPPRTVVHEIGSDWILVTRTDDFDVEVVQLLRLDRGDA